MLAYENGDEFLAPFHQAARGELDNFVLVMEGSIPNERINREGYWAALGTDPGYAATRSRFRNGSTGSRRARWRWSARAPARLTAAFMRWKAIPTGCMGLADYLGWEWKSKAGLPIVNVPGCPVQPDNFMETLLYLLYQLAGLAPMIPLDEALRPKWLFTRTVHDGCDRAGSYEQAIFATEYGSPNCIVKLGCWGPVVQCNVPKRGWMAGIGGCPNVGGICIGCTMPGFPGQVHAVHGRASRGGAVVESDQELWPADSQSAQADQQHAQRRTEMASQPSELTTGYRR